MIQIPLLSRDGAVIGVALTDDADDRLLQYTWRLHMGRYARRGDGARRVFMHREVLGLHPGGGEVDHINRDGLDNRRCNLRLVTHAENGQNLASRGGYSRYRGVTFDKRYGVWAARVSPNGRTISLGLYDCEFDAACAAARWRAEHWTHSEEDPALLGGTLEDALAKRRIYTRDRAAA